MIIWAWMAWKIVFVGDREVVAAAVTMTMPRMSHIQIYLVAPSHAMGANFGIRLVSTVGFIFKFLFRHIITLLAKDAMCFIICKSR